MDCIVRYRRPYSLLQWTVQSIIADCNNLPFKRPWSAIGNGLFFPLFVIWYLNPQENNVPPHSYTIKNGRFLRTNETIPTKILLILESGCTYSSFQMEIKRWRTWFISNKIERETYKKRKRSNALLQPLLTLNLILWKKSHNKYKISLYSLQIFTSNRASF